MNGLASDSPAPKLLDRVRHALRLGHYNQRTEEAYLVWVRRFILFHNKRHPDQMGEREVEAFLTSLAVKDRISASTQKQALGAILFLYRHVLKRELAGLSGVVRARMPERLPVVLSRDEVRAVLHQLRGVPWLIVTLLYGAGLRLNEALELRVKDVDFDRRQITVRRGKGGKDRLVPLPGVSVEQLRQHLADVQRRHGRDLASGLGEVALPDALPRKYPGAARAWPWQFVFPAGRVSTDPRWGAPTRFHLHESAIQREVTRAVRDARLSKRASCHTFRHHADAPA